MKDLEIKTNPKVKSVFDDYPDSVRDKVAGLRRLVIEAANETEGVTSVEETLKWGQPSYLTKNGSTIRIDWNRKQTDQYAMFFQCTSRLVPTFRMVYPDLFKFEGNRAIIFQMDDKLPVAELKNCIAAGLTYHKVKDLPLLGIGLPKTGT